MEPTDVSRPARTTPPLTTPTPHTTPPVAESDTASADSALSRRRFLQAAAGTAAAAGVTVVAGEPAAAIGTRRISLSFTAATNGSATLSPIGGPLIAEVQNVLWAIPRKGGDARQLTPPDLEPTRPVFAPDGERLAVCAYRGGGFHIWTLRPDGSEVRQRTDGPWDDRGPAWSPDGARIAFASERGGDPAGASPYRVWVLDVDSGGLTQITGLHGQQGPAQDGAWEDFDPVWSPDGERVLFVRGGLAGAALDARTIASVAADGSGPVTVEYTDETEAAQLMAPAVASDGRLACLRTTAAPDASCALLVDGKAVPVAGDVAPVPPRWTSFKELLLTVSGQFLLVRPDAPGARERISFTAELPVDRPQYRIKRYDFDGTGARPMRGMHLPALSPDGRQVAFGALNSLWVAPLDGGRAPRRVIRGAATRYPLGPTWTADGKALVYADDRDGLFSVYRHDLDSGERRVLASGGRVHPALSPDGSRLACIDMSGNLVVRDLPAGAERVLAAPMGAGGLPGRPSWSPDGRPHRTVRSEPPQPALPGGLQPDPDRRCRQRIVPAPRTRPARLDLRPLRLGPRLVARRRPTGADLRVRTVAAASTT